MIAHGTAVNLSTAALSKLDGGARSGYPHEPRLPASSVIRRGRKAVTLVPGVWAPQAEPLVERLQADVSGHRRAIDGVPVPADPASHEGGEGLAGKSENVLFGTALGWDNSRAPAQRVSPPATFSGSAHGK
jgi:hypothetical protein